VLYAYKYILLLAVIALPYLAISYRNRFDRALFTVFRFFMAVIVVWGWLFFCRFAVDYIDLRLAESPEQLNMVYSGDGARNVVVLMYGWVPGVVLASVSWCVERMRLRFQRRRTASVT
jgi:hypothetical protein